MVGQFFKIGLAALLALGIASCGDKNDSKGKKPAFSSQHHDIEQMHFSKLQYELLEQRLKEAENEAEHETESIKTYNKCIIAIHNKEYGFYYSTLDIPRLNQLGVSCEDAAHLARNIRSQNGSPYFIDGRHIVRYLEALNKKEGKLDIMRAKRIAESIALENTDGKLNYFTGKSFTLLDLVQSGGYTQFLKQ